MPIRIRIITPSVLKDISYHMEFVIISFVLSQINLLKLIKNELFIDDETIFVIKNPIVQCNK